MSKENFDQICKEVGLTIKSRHLYIDFTDIKYPIDKWECELFYNSTYAKFDFYTGYGNRTPKHINFINSKKMV
jgi:hypothetical protein